MPKTHERNMTEKNPVKRITKPARPNRFRYQSASDAALILELHQKEIALATVRGFLREDGAKVYEQVYWPVKAVALATGRKPRMIRQWAEEGKFIPAKHIGGRPVWAQEDVDQLLRKGDFFEQSIHDKGHAGDLAAKVADAKGETLDDVRKSSRPKHNQSGEAAKPAWLIRSVC